MWLEFKPIASWRWTGFTIKISMIINVDHQGQQRRLVARVKPVAESGTLPIICEGVTRLTSSSSSSSVRQSPSELQQSPDTFLNIVNFLIVIPMGSPWMYQEFTTMKFIIVKMFFSIAVGSPCIRSRLQRPLDSYQVSKKYKYSMIMIIQIQIQFDHDNHPLKRKRTWRHYASTGVRLWTVGGNI